MGVAKFYGERVFGCACCAIGGLVEAPVEVALATAKDFDWGGFWWGFGIDPTWEAVVFIIAFAKVMSMTIFIQGSFNYMRGVPYSENPEIRTLGIFRVPWRSYFL